MVGEANRCQNVRGLGGGVGGWKKKRDREEGGVCGWVFPLFQPRLDAQKQPPEYRH